jgi:SepF-like predicted cell division protein (DUF552 family)
LADSLLRAIHDRFTSSGLSATIQGGLWTSEVPEDVEFPYAAVEHESTRYEHTISAGSRKWVEHARVVFHLYAPGAEAVEDLVEVLVEAYAGGANVLAMDHKRVQAVLPDDLTVVSEAARDRDGHLIFRASVCFDIKISKS